jgi:hypothetical protein
MRNRKSRRLAFQAGRQTSGAGGQSLQGDLSNRDQDHFKFDAHGLYVFVLFHDLIQKGPRHFGLSSEVDIGLRQENAIILKDLKAAF